MEGQTVKRKIKGNTCIMPPYAYRQGIKKFHLFGPFYNIIIIENNSHFEILDYTEYFENTLKLVKKTAI